MYIFWKYITATLEQPKYLFKIAWQIYSVRDLSIFESLETWLSFTIYTKLANNVKLRQRARTHVPTQK